MTIPEIIARPPWPAARKRNVLALEVPAREERVAWTGNEQLEWSHPGGGVEKKLETWEREEIVTKLASKDIVRIDAATNLERNDLERALRECDVRFIDHYGLARALFAKYGASAVDAIIIALADKAPSSALEVLLRFDAISVPVRVANEYLIERWAERFPVTAALAFLPAALGADGKPRKAAQKIIAHLRKAGHEAAIREAAETFGEDASAEVDALFAPEPLPPRAPSLPPFVDFAKLPMPRTKDGEAIGDEPRERLVQLLSLLPLEAAKGAIEHVKAACESESLATLGLALAEAWVVAGAETKHKWALLAAGALGDDIAARKLAE